MDLPTVSICTPTFNRRPFIATLIRCVTHQTYPSNLIEWIIIDDGTDPIGDLVQNMEQVKYFYYPDKMTLGRKRNLMHSQASGHIIVYMDDDDYYPPERVAHAVETLLMNPQALCAGASEVHIYFKHIAQMYRFGPYKQSHATAASFAFKRQLLDITSYDELACVAEEKEFLKGYTIPFVQLESLKTILVFSHENNSFDKREMLSDSNPYINKSDVRVEDVVKCPEIFQFFMHDIDRMLSEYPAGDVSLKPDVLLSIALLKEQRLNIIYSRKLQELTAEKVALELKIAEQAAILVDIMKENQMLQKKVDIIKKIMVERR